jgi:hypothetical protein
MHSKYSTGHYTKGYSINGLVLLPGRVVGTWTWLKPNECIWDAPSTASSMYPVAYFLDRVFTDDAIDRAALEQFLRRTLQIRDCTVTDLIDELQNHAPLNEDKIFTHSKDDHYSVQAAKDVYNHLEKISSSLETAKKQELVYVCICSLTTNVG